MFKKILIGIFAFVFFIVLCPIIFYYVTYPLVPKYFATQLLKEYLVNFEEKSKEFSKNEPESCEHFVEERDAWRFDFEFLASLESIEEMKQLFEDSWEEERECWYAQINPASAFVANHSLKLFHLDTEITDFKDECTFIYDSFLRENQLYFRYKRVIDKEIASAKDYYTCRDLVSQNFDYSKFYDKETNEYLGSKTEDFIPLAEGFAECENELVKKRDEIYSESESIWKKVLEERTKRNTVIEDIMEELELDTSRD